MDNIVRVGIAGFGMSGSLFHAPFLHVHKHFEIKKVFERTSQKSKEEYPYVEVVRSYEDLLTDDMDLVVITTPNGQHFEMAKNAIEAGKNVVVEKPVAATSSEAEELCQLAKAKGVLLSVYQSRRLDGDFLTVKRLIEENQLGEVLDYHVHFDRFVVGKTKKEWKASGEKGTGILYDLGVHVIDQAVCLFGMPLEVYADFRKQRAETGAIDNFQVTLYYPNHKAMLFAGEVVLEKGPHFAVHGRHGSYVKYGMDVQEQHLVDGLRPGTEGWGEDPVAAWGVLHTLENGVEAREKIKTETGNYGAYYDNLYEAIVGGKPLLVKPEQTVDVLKIIEAAIKSDAEKRRISL